MMFYLPLYVQNAIYSAKNKQKVYLVRNRPWGVGRAVREKQAASRFIPTRSGPVRSQSGSVAEHTANECAI